MSLHRVDPDSSSPTPAPPPARAAETRQSQALPPGPRAIIRPTRAAPAGTASPPPASPPPPASGRLPIRRSPVTWRAILVTSCVMLCLSMIRTADNLRADAELATDPVASTADRTSPPPPALASPTIHGRHVAIRPDGN